MACHRRDYDEASLDAISAFIMAHFYILGICGTFMGGIARLAKALGHTVSGVDSNTYPPMSTQLEALGIKVDEGYEREPPTAVDGFIVGNAISRGNPMLENILDRRLAMVSGPQWLYEHVLRERWVLAVSGTHGKTTTSSMLTWILDHAGYAPGFLIGGVPQNFGVSARLGESEFFVIEADEYDSAFFDKRSKMIHYRPSTLIINNLEFDHADIFEDMAAIRKQFHHLVRTVPGNGQIIVPEGDDQITRVLEMGCWTTVRTFGAKDGDWQYRLVSADGQCFEFRAPNGERHRVSWSLYGEHNIANAVAAMAAAYHVGVLPAVAAEALTQFVGVARRMQPVANVAGIQIFEDFAHHPTAIRKTLLAARAAFPHARIWGIIDPRSNTMRMGVHKATLVPAAEAADMVVVHLPESLGWQPDGIDEKRVKSVRDIEQLLALLDTALDSGDIVVSMSNGGFGQFPQRLAERLEARQ